MHLRPSAFHATRRETLSNDHLQTQPECDQVFRPSKVSVTMPRRVERPRYRADPPVPTPTETGGAQTVPGRAMALEQATA